MRASNFLAFLSVFLALPLIGCASTDPLTLQNMQRFQQVWEEDKRADLPQALQDARRFEFEQAINYEKSKGGGK